MREPARDPTRLFVLWPRSTAPDGLVTLATDLSAFFHGARSFGADTALFLLTLRALRQRSLFGVHAHDLAWTLGLTRRAVRRRLHRLARLGLIVFRDSGANLIYVEFTGDEPKPGIFSPTVSDPMATLALPTHWILEILPSVGRRPFLAYLYLRSREADERAGLLLSSLAPAIGCRMTICARLALWRLRCAGLVRMSGGTLVVHDPPPISRWTRVILRLRAAGLLPASAIGRAALMLIVVSVPFALALLLATR